MMKSTVSVGDMLLQLFHINNLIDYIHKRKWIIALKYHYFEVVTFEIFEFESHKYEEITTF